MTSRLLCAFGLVSLVCAGALPGAPLAEASAADAKAKATVKAVGRTSATMGTAAGAVGARATSIMGSAWNSDNTAIPAAKLRLRNLLTGRIEATTIANDLGQFTFGGIESGSYVVELVSENGKIIAIGHPFTVAAGETVATFVRLASKAPWFNAFFGNAASAAASVAASTGVTAVAPEKMACASPPCSQ